MGRQTDGKGLSTGSRFRASRTQPKGTTRKVGNGSSRGGTLSSFCPFSPRNQITSYPPPPSRQVALRGDATQVGWDLLTPQFRTSEPETLLRQGGTERFCVRQDVSGTGAAGGPTTVRLSALPLRKKAPGGLRGDLGPELPVPLEPVPSFPPPFIEKFSRP